MIHKLLIFLAVVAFSTEAFAFRNLDKSLGWPGTTLSGVDCYARRAQAFGPYDYTDPETARAGRYGGSAPLYLVEMAHFTPAIEALVGKTGSLERDLDYTLRAFPNHHRALWSMSRFYMRLLKSRGHEKMLANERRQNGTPPPECYFQRAMEFSPQDAMVPAIFGIYLHRMDKLDEALKFYEIAQQELSDYPELIYNMGLLYFDLGEVEKAKEYADRASSLGYPLTGLHKKISRKAAGSGKGN